MKKNEAESDLEMRAEYDFSNGIRGKYAERYARGTNLVLLDDDVAEVFPDSASVNRALRALADIVKERSRGSRHESLAIHRARRAYDSEAWADHGLQGNGGRTSK